MKRFEVSELAALAGRALERAVAGLRDGDPESAALWLDHLVCLRALEWTREVEILAAMELGVLDGGP